MLTFAKPSDPVLNQSAKPVKEEEFNTTALTKTIEEMLSLATIEQSDGTKYMLVGLAAPQVGLLKRIILVDVTADGKGTVQPPQPYINPEIIATSTETTTWYEGCYSTGNITGVVTRPKTVTIRARKPDGSQVEETHHDYIARIFQHEIDHLNGVRFPSKADILHRVEPHEMPLYRNQQGWRSWPHTCTHADFSELAQLRRNTDS